MGQLEPGPGESVGKFPGVFQIAPGDGCEERIVAQREVCRGHHRPVLLGRVVSVSHHIFFGHILGQPLLRAGRAFDQFPLVFKQHVEIAHVPLGRVRFPGALDTAAGGIAAFAAAKAVLPAEALFLQAGSLRFRADQGRIPCAVTLAEGMSAGNESNRFFVVHSHPGEGFPYVTAGGDGIRIAVGPFRIDVDQAHLYGGEGIFQIPVAGVAFVAKPLGFRAPIYVFFRLPNILAPAAEAEGFKSHGLESASAGEDHQVGPGNFPTVFLLNGPEQTACFVQVHVVGPAVEGR